MSTHIAVVGAGGVGGYFGGRLALAGCDVAFLARGRHLEALRSGLLRVDSIKGDFEIKVTATDVAEDIGIVDFAIIAVKAWQVTEAASAIAPMIGPDSLVVPLQNGIEAPAQLSAVLGCDHVAGGLCTIIAYAAGPGHVKHVGAEPLVAFGELHCAGQVERLRRLEEEFTRAGVACGISADIEAAMWEKFLFIAPLSGLGAMTKLPVDALRADETLRDQLARGMREILDLARAQEVGLATDIVEKTLRIIDAMPDGSTTSMQRAIMAGRPSELEAQIGAVVRLGRAKAIPTPVHELIYDRLESLERRARGH